jgi:hypothetical protein
MLVVTASPARTALKISQLTRQPPGGMPSTYDSMHKTLAAFFARQTIVNEASFIGPVKHSVGKFCFSKILEMRLPRTMGKPYAPA